MAATVGNGLRNAIGTVAHNRMKRIIYLLFIAISAVGLFSCDDNTDMLGTTIVPDGDKIEIDTVTFYAKSRSILANDSILANTNRVYLGRYTDPESDAVFLSDFIAQFNCVEDYGFPSDGVIGDSVVKIELKLFYNSYFGDSLNTMGCAVYELDRTLEEGVPYYTNIDPTEFYDEDKAAIAEKAYCAIDYAIHDSIRYGDDFTPSITIPLPQELGNRFIQKYYETDANGDSIGKSYFANSENFIDNVLKGLYVKTTQGDGTVIYVSMARLNVHFSHYVKSSSGKKDSIATAIATFSSTKEVLQVNKFNNGDLSKLVEDNSCTYLKTPAGIFTEVELPVKEIIANTDTLNLTKITFTRYNQTSDYMYRYSIPAVLLMVRKSEMYDFFLKNKSYDNKTSFYSTFSSTYNQYVFNNISRLINYCNAEYEKGIASDPAWEEKNPDWNKVVLIPVSTTKDSNGNIVGMTHDLKMNSIKLRGGKDNTAIKIVTSRFKDSWQ